MKAHLKSRKDHAEGIMRYLGYIPEAIHRERGKVKHIENILEHYLNITLKESGIKEELRDIKNQLKVRP